jgi:hypothetical protein
MDEEAAALLDLQAPDAGSGDTKPYIRTAIAENHKGLFPPSKDRSFIAPADGLGGASRFFYCAKAHTGERESGLAYAGIEAVPPTDITGREPGSAGQDNPRAGMTGDTQRRCTHPTVKPLDLMRWLVRLVKMPANTRILDPFAGSGTTGVAAVHEGVDMVGIELDPRYAEIARARIKDAVHQAQPGLPLGGLGT